MKKLWIITAGLVLAACNSKPSTDTTAATPTTPAKDTTTYAYKAVYSSDISVPGNTQYAKEVLDVWKAFEMNQIQTKRASFADTVTYDDASGFHFHGPADTILAIAKQDISGLDSLRFDIDAWQSAHVNDKGDDYVNIWAVERRYPKKGGHADTTLIQENWVVKDGKIVSFDQYKKNPPKQ